MDAIWRIQLFGDFQVQSASKIVPCFATQKAGLLLAYLAYHAQKAHSREVLTEMLWQDMEPTVGRNRFKQTLASLRRHLEPLGTTATLIEADRYFVRLNRERVVVDVLEFQTALRQAKLESDSDSKKLLLCRAVECYRRELLPGCYADWVLTAQRSLGEAYLQALRQLVSLHSEEGEEAQALVFARLAVEQDPQQEALSEDLCRLYLALDRPAEALRAYQHLERVLREEFGESPSARLQALVATLKGRAEVRATPSAPLQVVKPSLPKPPSSSPVSAPWRQSLTPLTPFFGREEEIASMVSLLSKVPTGHGSPPRIVTLMGSGGSGKTRLAMEVAQRLFAKGKGGGWVVPLVNLQYASQVPNAIRESLGLLPSPTLSAMEQVLAFFQEREAKREEDSPADILVLDNFEHLDSEGEKIALELVERIPFLTLLVTSRRALAIAGEREVFLPPLPTPEPSTTPEEALLYPSVQLFVDRAQARRSGFVLTEKNGATISALCRKLEGVPLAIELAAAWTNSLTSAQILERSKESLDLLVSHRKDRHPRHLSVRAAIDWSYHLLPQELQRFFVRLSVFNGGWTLDAAERVCEEPQALLFLERLQDQSLIWTKESGETMRFTMLETIRQYAAEILAESGEQEAVATRHFETFLALAQRQKAVEVKADYDNVLAAMNWGLTTGSDLDRTLELLRVISLYWGGGGLWSEGRAHIARFLAISHVPLKRKHRAVAVHSLAIFCTKQSDFSEAKRWAHEALALWEAEGDMLRQAAVLDLLGVIALEQGDNEAAPPLLEKALLLLQQADTDPTRIAGVLHNLGCVLQRGEDLQGAWERQQEALILYGSLGHLGGVALCKGFLGEIARLRENYAVSITLLEESLALFRADGETPRIAEMLVQRAILATEQQDWVALFTTLQECLPMLFGIGDKRNMARALEEFAAFALFKQEAFAAARLCGIAAALRASLEMELPRLERVRLARNLDRLRTALGESRFVLGFEEGQRVSWEEIPSLFGLLRT